MNNYRYGYLARKLFSPNHNSLAAYSKNNKPSNDNYYKIVGKVRNSSAGKAHTQLAPSPNWEILTPRGYRFYMPGNIGPAWHDSFTTKHTLPQIQDFDLEATDLECYAQECPILLRQTVTDLFRGIDFSYSQLTVISLSQKSFKYTQQEMEIENITKRFVLAAQDICRKLKTAGYWADFINPFSGVPFIHYTKDSKLYENDTRFRCLGFRIIERQKCRIIEDKKTRRFIGSLFTTAPPNVENLKNILLEND